MDKHLDALSEQYFKDLLAFFPPFGTYAGIHEYDELMPEGTPEALDGFRERRKKFRDEVAAIDPAKLTFDRRIDREALLHTLDVQIHEDDAHGRNFKQPTAGHEISTAIHMLFIKEFAPLEERLRRITCRLEKVPQYLENTKGLLTQPVTLWTQMGIEECKSTVAFIQLIQDTAERDNIGEHVRKPLNRAARFAVNALYNNALWLCEKLPFTNPEFSMKPEDFEKLIELRNLGMNTDEMLAYASEALEQANALKQELAAKVAPGVPLDEFQEMMEKSRHPQSFDEALRLTREATEASRTFVLESGFATIPENEELHVIETPEFIRNIIPFGAYMPPGRFDLKQVGRYWLTPPPGGADILPENHNIGAILNTSVHEGYPGHHLNLVCANINTSPSRLLTEGIEFVEGWAHYCEEMTARMGFSTEPEVMFERYNDIAWRAARIIVDIKLSRGELTFDEAVDFLQKISGFDRQSCITEVRRYTFTPGYQLSYLIGKKRIMEIHDCIEKEAGDRFDLRKFHDTMLYAGVLPLAVMEKVVRNAFALEPVKA